VFEYRFCILCSHVSFTSLFPLYLVQYKFIANYSAGGNVNSHSAHFDICVLPKYILMAARGSAGEEASGRWE